MSSRVSSPDSILSDQAEKDSIFGDDSSQADSLIEDEDVDASHPPAVTDCPPVRGLYIFPGLLDEVLAEDTLDALVIHDTFTTTRNQAMLFTRPPPHSSSLPSYLINLEKHVATLLQDQLPTDTHSTAFNPEPPLARQMILNCYAPGEGISSHVDLVDRYSDGIIGISLEGGAVMDLSRVGGTERHHVWLPPRTIYVLCGEARWEWEHGIRGRHSDVVVMDGQEVRIPRSQRTSVTMRWMKPGADELR